MSQSNILQQQQNNALNKSRWRSLFYFNIYRLVFASVAVALAVNINSDDDSYRFPTLFLACGLAMICMTILYFLAINRSKPDIDIQINIQGFLDLIFITVLTYSSNGFESGYSILMVISVASTSLLSSKQIAFASAAFGTLLMLSESLVVNLRGLEQDLALQGPAFFGIALFTSAFTVNLLASKIRYSEALAIQRGAKLASMDLINHQVVELIPTGVMAVNSENIIILCNARARSLLSLDVSPEEQSLLKIAPEIQQYLDYDHKNQDDNEHHGVEINGVSMLPTCQHFGEISLIFLEDLSNEQEQSRQLRLAAMGRLASAIAHDIRNPLSAIYQSAELLGESNTLNVEDKQLINIVQTQSERINKTVESVLMISRGESGDRVELNLHDWLQSFIKQFCQLKSIPHDQIEIKGHAKLVLMDPHHLDQILTNLIDNALAHTNTEHKPYVTIQISTSKHDNRPYIDVIDYGEKISESSKNKLFEPFFTTRSRGTGLGLYISRELCEANFAKLNFYQDNRQKYFRLTLQSVE